MKVNRRKCKILLKLHSEVQFYLSKIFLQLIPMWQSHWLRATDDWAQICVSSVKGFVTKLFFDDSRQTMHPIEKVLTPSDKTICLFDA